MQSYYNINDYIPYVLHCGPVTCLFYNWKFVPLNPLHLFCQPHSHPSSNLLVCYLPLSLFLFCLFISFVNYYFLIQLLQELN